MAAETNPPHEGLRVAVLICKDHGAQLGPKATLRCGDEYAGFVCDEIMEIVEMVPASALEVERRRLVTARGALEAIKALPEDELAPRDNVDKARMVGWKDGANLAIEALASLEREEHGVGNGPPEAGATASDAGLRSKSTTAPSPVGEREPSRHIGPPVVQAVAKAFNDAPPSLLQHVLEGEPNAEEELAEIVLAVVAPFELPVPVEGERPDSGTRYELVRDDAILWVNVSTDELGAAYDVAYAAGDIDTAVKIACEKFRRDAPQPSNREALIGTGLAALRKAGDAIQAVSYSVDASKRFEVMDRKRVEVVVDSLAGVVPSGLDAAEQATDLAERYGEAIVAISRALVAEDLNPGGRINRARGVIAGLAEQGGWPAPSGLPVEPPSEEAVGMALRAYFDGDWPVKESARVLGGIRRDMERALIAAYRVDAQSEGEDDEPVPERTWREEAQRLAAIAAEAGAIQMVSLPEDATGPEALAALRKAREGSLVGSDLHVRAAELDRQVMALTADLREARASKPLSTWRYPVLPEKPIGGCVTDEQSGVCGCHGGPDQNGEGLRCSECGGPMSRNHPCPHCDPSPADQNGGGDDGSS